MLDKTRKTWQQSNHENLLAEITLLKQTIRTHLPSPSQPSAVATIQPLRATAEHNVLGKVEVPKVPEETPVMLDNLCAVFSLSRFDRQLLLLCAAVELDGEVAGLCAEVSGQSYPSLTLALALFEGHYSVLAADAPLCYYQLIEQKADHNSLVRQSLSISPWALYYLTGMPSVDARLQILLQPVSLMQPILPSHQTQAEQLQRRWASRQDEPMVTQLMVTTGNDQRQVAALAAADYQRSLYELNLFQLSLNNEELDHYRRLLEREILTNQCLILIDCQRLQPGGEATAEAEAILYPLRAWLERLLRGLSNACVLVASQPIVLPSVQIHYQHLPKLPQAEQIQLWQHCLSGEDLAEEILDGETEAEVSEHGGNPSRMSLTATLKDITAQFNLNSQQLRNIAQQARHSAADDPQLLEQHLWQHSREQCRQHLQGLVKVVAPTALSWDDLILPVAESETLKTILAQVEQRQRVYQHWGFAKQVPYGLGINALFTGSSGTGKTMAARIIASQLQLDLYHVDLSSVVDKYIGETEKKLDKIFQAAENSGAILLFDEADALFGKRSKVQDARDRYANMGISFLLQRMESYSGLSILTTNLRSAMDDAFLRRLRFILPFPFPGASERQRLWQLMIPDSAPQHGIDPEKLARLTLSGGSIRSIALQAAFMAAESNDQVITMQHLLQATRQQYLKAEKTLDTKLVGDWIE